MIGACEDCPSSSITLKQGVEKMLMHYQSLENLNWNLVTIVPANLISEEVNRISAHNQLVSWVMFFLLLCVTAVITIQQSRYRRSLEKVAFTDPVTGGVNSARFRLLAAQRLAVCGAAGL